mmetsp:Transcript_22068/g.75673  ORF Transcript_22068/g.75673 Transcript_22068/m.75673 type:complete len:329 (-) Transcript_22068:319-1305(-)|eukprot:CAMPEP_0204173422 /NCGR_PEP_ID=MMETSP0361-20130328/44983_1 /ASSEMBLY_ACC=CAM_ASM_000343 /TAXON_ID=268821 /ORGANISM="Scrippsiella Hangoei, Strain SHTV-5" /LENGTH=328 /DNA_ID=CAMNT_0051131715 /DNA_START=19 /DNA_END=1005 /DNA_ORIENTATION=-
MDDVWLEPDASEEESPSDHEEQDRQRCLQQDGRRKLQRRSATPRPSTGAVPGTPLMAPPTPSFAPLARPRTLTKGSAATMSTSCEALSDLGDVEADFDRASTMEGPLALHIPDVDHHIVYDVIGGPEGQPHVLPVRDDGLEMPSCPVSALPEDTLLDVRVFRFFEDLCSANDVWEQEMRNVNTGSLLWLPVHLQPKMHSGTGCKFGKWFTIHHIRVFAKHFQSGYHMAEEGSSFAKTFGSTLGLTNLITGGRLPRSYFWFVSPDNHGFGKPSEDVKEELNLLKHGWQHVAREGPFDGDGFMSEWHTQGSPVEERCLQKLLRGFVQNRG